ncbi:MAG: M3 family metallopeptidase [Pirellula sp.]
MTNTRYFESARRKPVACALSLQAFFIMGASANLLAQNPQANSPTSLATAKTMNQDNPFFEASQLPFQAPDFGSIKPEHFAAAFEAGFKQQLEQIRLIADQKDPPSFENTLVAMEKSGEILTRVSAVFFNLAGAHTNESIQEIEQAVAPKLARHSDDIYLNKKLFGRVEKLWQERKELPLSEEQQRLLKKTYEDFVRAGAKLTDSQQAEVRSINERMSTLTTQFQNNLLAVTKERAVLVDDIKQLEGMSDGEIAAAKQAASARGNDGQYLLAITNTTRQPVLTSLKNRELRRKVWLASSNRALGENGGIDNQPLVLELAKLRSQRAKLLGYENHASYTLENQMAGNPRAAMKMLEDLVPGVVQKVKSESSLIAEAMKEDGLTGPVEPWDWEYYAEKVRAKKYQVDESAIKPYFELESVLQNGVFFTYKKLYGVEFKERKDLPVWHPSVRVFDVLGQEGKPIGLFYADYFQRDSKRGGAWMDSLVSQARLLHQLPVVINVMNIPTPAEGQPALMSLDHVQTMFHELGHGVHGLFSSVEYPSLSGTSVPRDYVEFPSTFHEDWAIEPDILANYARHYQTGDVLPKSLLDKAIAANKFNKGFDSLEYLSAALLDLAWHSLPPDRIPSDVARFEKDVLLAFGIDLPAVPPRYRSSYFAHVWSGGYSAGYYAYLWSEVLAADAYAFMKQSGGLTGANGASFREKILSKGGSREVMQQYIDFRGQEPGVEALLIRRGLKD